MRNPFIILILLFVSYLSFGQKNENELGQLRKKTDTIIRKEYYEGLNELNDLIKDSKKKNWIEAEALLYRKIHQLNIIYRKTDSINLYRKVIDEYYYQNLSCHDKYYYKLECSNHFFNISQFDSVLETGKIALDIADSCELPKTDALLTLAAVKSAIGSPLESIKDFKEAAVYCLNQKPLDTSSMYMIYFNIGAIYANLFMYDSSNKYLKESIKMHKRPNSFIIICDNLMKQNAPQNEIDFYFDSINKMFSEHRYPNLLHMYYIISSNYHFDKQNYALAEKFSDSLILTAKKTKEPNTIKISYYHKIRSVLKDKSFLLDSLNFYTDSVNTKEITEKTLELDKIYETNKKERTIAKLNADIKDKEIKTLTFRNYLLYGGIGTILLLFTFVFVRRKRRKILKDKVEELRRQALKLQMNPHFFFNSLNSINNFIVKNEKQEAQKFLTSFSRLMRLTLENSQEDLITTEQEEEFLTHYLELEKQRHKNFDYEINFDSSTNNLKVPGFLIQPLIENSIIHGFRDIEYRGKIEIELKKEDQNIILTVTDNGVGMNNKQPKENKKHKSFASKILRERVQIYNGSVEEISLSSEDKITSGTKIVIKLPIIS